MTLQTLRRRVWQPALAVAVVLAVLAVRATVEQQAAWARAVELERQGKLADAIDEYRWTLRWYTPWGPAWDDAAEALRDLGTRHQQQDPELAVQALDGLRSGLIASRSLWQPRSDLVQWCNRTLPPLLVRVADRQGDTRDKAKLLQQFQADYARPVGVGPWVSLAVSGGFLLWLLGLVQTVRKGVGEDGRMRPAGWKWLGGAGVGFAAWLAAMWLG